MAMATAIVTYRRDIERNWEYFVQVFGQEFPIDMKAGFYATPDEVFDTAFYGRLTDEAKQRIQNLQKG
jgi:hypothetical protein